MDSCSPQQVTSAISGDRGEHDLQTYHITIFKISSSQKNYKLAKETWKYSTFIGRSKIRNLWRSPNIDLLHEYFKLAMFKDAQWAEGKRE